MAVQTYNLGIITAYGDAKAGGYTGTKAEWQELMANYATVGQQAAQDAQTATIKADEASASADRAETAVASIPTPDTTLTQAGVAADAKATGDEISILKEELRSIIVTDSVSGSVAHFVDGADDIPMKSVKVNIEPVQSGSGDPSPSNVRAISGRNSVKVTRAGKNAFSSKGLTQTLNGITIHSNDDGSFTVNGTATANAQFDLTLNNELKLQSGQYTVGMFADKAVTFDTQHVWWFFYSMDAHADIVNCQTPSKTFTLNAVTATRFYLRIISGATVDNVTFYPMLVYGSDAPTEFEPYNGDTYDISLASAGTVYGGTLDVVSGLLTVERIFRQAVSSELDSSHWAKGGATQFDEFYMKNTNATYGKPGENYGIENIICSHAPSLSSASTSQMFTRLANREARIVFPLSMGIDSLSAFYTWNQTQIDNNNPLQFCYVLNTPQTYQLSTTEINSLLGINSVWSDAGDVDVEYIANTKLFIERLTAPDSADMIADSNIVSGKYFMVGNNLYKATANIANGSAIIVGTNCTRKSLSEALNEINA